MTRRDWLRRTALSITAVRFPARDFEITKYGAVGDGKKVSDRRQSVKLSPPVIRRRRPRRGSRG